MDLGAFSISLAVKDLEASRNFYEKFGFRVFAGDASQNWLIMKNGDHVIGLFQRMFEKKILTCNPGWDLAIAKSADALQFSDTSRNLRISISPNQLQVLQIYKSPDSRFAETRRRKSSSSRVSASGCSCCTQ